MKIKEQKRALQVNRRIYGKAKVKDSKGNLSFACDDKKAQWYLKKDYAKIVSKEPLVIQLNWDYELDRKEDELLQSMKKLYEHESYKLDKENVCAVCGKIKEFARFQTLPLLYKTYLPYSIKILSSADVILLC